MPPKRYFSYVRVSTLKQGQLGTSLTEQRAAIERYATRWSLQIVKEFEEKETAAKSGRPVFLTMLQLLKRAQAEGVIIHKIDRSARNLKDWADLGELIDQGLEVHFANESLDLHSRGGRLSADIQAVVAADYIRNLREETKKGFYGRLRQGLYPRPAPVGYLDSGKGRAKEIDPVRAPLVKQAFELYATGRWPLNALVEKMYELGLRNKKGGRVTRNGLALLLHNPFFTGTIQLKISPELYPGVHQPIISQELFKRVQGIFGGKTAEKKNTHWMLFRRCLSCSRCGFTLIGEISKGRIYYRCHTKSCPQKCIREDRVEEQFTRLLQSLRFSETENRFIRTRIKQSYQELSDFKMSQTAAFNLQLQQIQNRQSALADGYIDGVLDKELYLDKKNRLIEEQQAVKEGLENLDSSGQAALQRVEQFLELLNNAYSSYKLANPEERREMVRIVTSNSLVEEKSVIFKLNYPFRVVIARATNAGGSPGSVAPRTLLALLRQLRDHFAFHELKSEIDH